LGEEGIRYILVESTTVYVGRYGAGIPAGGGPGGWGGRGGDITVVSMNAHISAFVCKRECDACLKVVLHPQSASKTGSADYLPVEKKVSHSRKG
jgi:hypothetical protein